MGPNGAGKSNFLDSLRFVADALHSSLDHAIRNRGGINDVRRRSGGHPKSFQHSPRFHLTGNSTGHYVFRIGARPRGGYEVQKEECMLQGAKFSSQKEYFRVENGTVTETSVDVAPAATMDRLYLVNASGLKEFRPVYEAFSQMGFYSLNPDKIRDLQAPDPGDLLIRDGSNLASVLAQLSPLVKGRIEEYLGKVVPGVHEVKVKKFGPKETLQFRQGVAGAKQQWRVLANNMSDGTLRLWHARRAVSGESRPPNVRAARRYRRTRNRASPGGGACCLTDFVTRPKGSRSLLPATVPTCLMTRTSVRSQFSQSKHAMELRLLVV